MLVMTDTFPKYRLNGHLTDIVTTEQSETFSFGWRWLESIGPDGQTTHCTVALTLDDFLDPQLGDQMPQGIKHAAITDQLFDKLDNFCAAQPQTLVLEDVKMVWRIPNLPEPFPDIAVIHGLTRDELDENSGSFDCVEYGVRPSLIIEVMSPSYAKGDRLKVGLYETAEVTEYIIINPRTKQPHKPFELIGYRLQGGRYQPIQPDAQGRLLSQTTGVLIGLTGEDKRTVEVYDAQTGARLLDHRETEQARLAERQARYEADTRADSERQARYEAETRADSERQARLQAEAQLRQTVLTLLDKGLSLELISQATGMSQSDIQQIQTQDS